MKHLFKINIFEKWKFSPLFFLTKYNFHLLFNCTKYKSHCLNNNFVLFKMIPLRRASHCLCVCYFYFYQVHSAACMSELAYAFVFISFYSLFFVCNQYIFVDVNMLCTLNITNSQNVHRLSMYSMWRWNCLWSISTSDWSNFSPLCNCCVGIGSWLDPWIFK